MSDSQVNAKDFCPDSGIAGFVCPAKVRPTKLALAARACSRAGRAAPQ
jgi:hypothetical protein